MATKSIVSKDTTGSEKLDYFASLSDYDGPQNPLNQFRSYSYHFVLYVTDTTENAEKLGGSSGDVDLYDQVFGRADSHKSNNVDNYFDKYEVREFDGIRYVTVINSFEDADLIIDDLQYSATSSAPLTGQASQTKADTLQVGFDTTFKIFEPLGCRLLEILSQTHIALNQSSPIYGLKVYFIGRQDELALTGAASNSITPGPDGVGFFYSLKPILFMVNDIQLNVTTEGTMYQFAAVNIINGTNTQLGTNLAGSASVDKRDPTLEEVCNSYTTSINEAMAKSKEYVDETGQQSTIPVEYSVVFEDALHGKDPNVKKHIKDSIVDNVTNAQRGESGVIIQPPATLNFPSRIAYIVKLCSEITNVPKGDNRLFTFAVTTSTISGTDKIKYIAHVIRKKVETIPVAESGTPADQAEKINEVAYKAYEEGRLLHYQYYFSGKNVDIIKYDLNVSIGWNAVFSSFSPSKNPDQKKITNDAGSNDAVIRSTNTEPSDKTPKPHMGVQTSPTSARNLKDPSSHDAFVEFMRQHMLGDNSSVSTVLIRGNPKLFQASIATPKSQSESGQKQSQESTNIDDKNTIIDSILVKLDVFSPSRQWSSSFSDQLTPETKFSESFWHGGLFRLVTVKSMFVRGVFTQELMIFRVPTDSNRPAVVGTTKEKQPAATATPPAASSKKTDEALSNQPQGNCSRPGLGKLSAKHESGAAGEIAIGYDNKGGWSYGSYQIATKTGTFAEYMAICRADYPTIYEKLQSAGGVQGATAGTNEFKSAWKSLKGNAAFKESQHEFVRIHIFNVMVQRIKKKSGVDICNRSNGLQDTIWSTAVHHGPYKQFPVDIIDKLKNADDAAMINAIYDERSKVDKHFASQPQRNRENIRRRFVEERAQALRMI